MKRGKPLKAGKPLARKAPMGARGATLRAGKRLAGVSGRKRDEITQRATIRLEIALERGPRCQACFITPVGTIPRRYWTELHEVLSRARGGSPLDKDNILALCSPCHRWVTTHPAEATALGLLRSRTAREHRRETGS